MTPDIAEQLENAIQQMSGAQQKVAGYILDDIMGAALSTIEQIARAAEVSTSSVVRLANSLGYDTFSEFQHALKDYLRNSATPINKFSFNVQDNASSEENSAIAESYRIALENLSSAYQNVNEEELEAIAKKIAGARYIFVCGARTSESVARYLSFNLNRMFMNAIFVDESPSRQLDLQKRIGPEDVLIVITLSRYNKTVVNAAALSHEKGIDVIAVTDSAHSPLAPLCKLQLTGKSRSNAFHNSVVAQVFLCDIIIKACSQISEERVRSNLKLDETFVKRMQYYHKK